MITLSLGYDSYLGFLICIIGTGFGFACAITNPFTVITASNIIGANPMANLWFRILIFVIMYGLLIVFIFNHIKRIKKEDILPFGKKIGAGTIIIGVTIIIAGVVTYIMQTDEIAKWIVTVGFSSGLTIILYNIIKYNKGLF